jgi:hypothetical protein
MKKKIGLRKTNGSFVSKTSHMRGVKRVPFSTAIK